MKKTILSIACIVLATAFATAQSVDDGIRYLYYGKDKSAKDALQQVVSKNPKDGRSIYWLGQALLAQGNSDVAGAKTLYQNALNSGVNDPYILVGMGELDLIQNNDVNAAKQKFEQAITMSKNKKGQEDPNILNAIGRANAYGGNKVGDPVYAVDLLKKAAQIDPKNPDIDINLGINYLKMGSDKGGEAVTAFQDATVRDPKNAAGFTRIGNIYKSQDNKPSMEEWYNKAIAADATYAPVYYNWFDYYQNRDINAAQDYLNNYVKYADQDCNTEYFKANYLFRAGKYEESKAAADAMAAGSCKNFPKLNMLYAYNYDRLGDSANAKNYIDKFFSKQAPSPEDAPYYYTLASKVYSKFPGQEDTAAGYIMKAMDADTVAKNKQKYLDSIASIYKRANMPEKRLAYRRQSFALNKDTSSRDFYDVADAAIAAKDTAYADTIIALYRTKFPDQIYPYTFAVKNAQAADTTGEKAVGPINDYIGYLSQDTAKNAATIAYYYALQGGYYANTAKNFDSAIYEFQQAVKYDPNQAQYQQYLSVLEKAADKKKAVSQPKSSAKKASGSKSSATKPRKKSGN